MTFRRHRFKVRAAEYNPANRPPGPWHITAGTADEMTIVCELPADADVLDYWPGAWEIDSTVPLDESSRTAS